MIKLGNLSDARSTIDKPKIKNFIETLNVDEAIKEELRAITPFNYIGKIN